MSFGVFFHDVSIDFEHSAIWNISADTTSLPQGVEVGVANPPSVPGAVQCRSWINMYGYGGPGSNSNIYQFTLYALDVADLDAEIDSETNLVGVRNAFEDHVIESVTISGQTEGPP